MAPFCLLEKTPLQERRVGSSFGNGKDKEVCRPAFPRQVTQSIVKLVSKKNERKEEYPLHIEGGSVILKFRSF